MLLSLANTTSTAARTSSENVTVRVSAFFFQSFKVIMLEKCVLTILELNWNKRFRDKKAKLNICHHMLTLSTQPQSRSFHVVERTRTSSKCQNMKNARAKRAKILSFIVKYANLWGFCCCRRRRGCHFDFLFLSCWRSLLVTTTWLERPDHPASNLRNFTGVQSS